jgi:hypothetical protein
LSFTAGETVAMSEPTSTEARWLTPGVRGIGAASFLADVGHEFPTALLPNLLTATLGVLPIEVVDVR